MKNLLLIILIFTAFSMAQEIAYSSFEEPETGGKYTDTFDAASDHALVNNPGQAPVNYTSSGGELGFSSYYYNTRNGDGLTDGDFVGVTDNTSDVGGFPDGGQGYIISDADGYMVTTTDRINVSSYNSVLVSLEYFLATTGYESNDMLRIWLVLDDTLEIDMLNTEGTDINDLMIEGKWEKIQKKVDGVNTISVNLGFDCNAEDEAVYIDNIRYYAAGDSNLPPVIEEFAASKLPPNIGYSCSDTVKVYDADGNISGVSLNYSVNAGDTVSMEMRALGYNSLFAADIPDTSYTDEDEVVFWVSANDDSGSVTISKTQAFFAGITPIEIFKLWDNDYISLQYQDYYVRTSGVATVGDSIFSNTNMDFFIQEEGIGLNVFKNGAGNINIIPGRRYTIRGRITQNNGLIKIIPDYPETDVIDEGEAAIPDPETVDMATLLSNAEFLEGLLVRCMNVDTVASYLWPQTVSNEDIDLLISDDGGLSNLVLYLDKDTDIPGTTEPAWPQHITGIFSQSDSSAPYTSGYRLMPRRRNDFENTTPIADRTSSVPDELILYHAYPNPFNPATTISFNIPVNLAGRSSNRLIIYDILGQSVKQYNLTNVNAGLNKVVWEGKSDTGRPVASGVYFAVLQADNLKQWVKLLLIK